MYARAAGGEGRLPHAFDEDNVTGMNKILKVSPIALAVLASCSTARDGARPERPLPEFSIELAEDIIFEVDPRIELLAGVQSMTSWVRDGGSPRGADGAYYSALRSRFAPLAKGRAVKASQALTDRGFTYDAPPTMALSLDGGEAFDAPAEGWSSYLKGRAGGARRLENFRIALGEAYDASGFRGFLSEHEVEYRRWIEEASAGFDAKAIPSWLEKFYGPSTKPVYHFVFAPAMFPGGGYGFSRLAGKGAGARLQVYQIVRAQGSGADGSSPFPSGKELAALGLHEFGHSFVNPALEKGSADPRLARIFAPVAAKMRSMAYGQVPVFLNELVLRAATVMGRKALGLIAPERVASELESERAEGFYPIARVYAMLEEYEADRARYPDFSGFGPVVLERLASEADAILAEGGRDNFGGTGLAGPRPVDSFSEGFEGGDPLKAFALDVGSRIDGGKGMSSTAAIDASEPGSASLRLEADADTSSWRWLHRPIAVRKGVLTLSYRCKGEAIRKEAGQFGGSYVGFVVEGTDGNKRFAVRMHSGSFPWGEYSLQESIDPRKVASIEFAAFLNESGRMWLDDVEAGYR